MSIKIARAGLPATAILLALSWTAHPAIAQSPPDAGQVLRETQPRAVVIEPPAVPALRIEEPAQRDTSNAVRFDVRAIRVTGSAAFAAATLEAMVADMIGPGRSLPELEAAARRISAYYRERGYAVARAYLPAQDIRNGVVTISVAEGSLGAKTLDNRSTIPATHVQAVLDNLESGMPVRTGPTNRAMLLLGELPGAGKVDGRLKPGDQLGSSDLLISIEPGNAIEGSITADNFGNRFTGAHRVTGQISLNNPLRLADRLRVHGTVSDEQLVSGRAAWDVAANASGLRVGVSASTSRYKLAEEFAALRAHGTAHTTGGYATYPLILMTDVRVRTGGSLERRWIRDHIDAVGSSVSKSANALVLELSGELLALLGDSVTTWRVSPTFGELSIDTPAARVDDQLSARTDGGYRKWTASVVHEQRLPARFSLYGAASGQWASGNLDSSEKFVLGGVYGIRAYPQGEAAGDKGWLANLEVRYALLPALRGSVFYDTGRIDINRNPYLPGDNSRHLSGYGIGLSSISDAFSINASLAWRGGSEAPRSDRDKTPRLWLQGGWRY